MQDAVYIELAGSHANEEDGAATNQLVSSLISARHPLDLKMKHAEMTLMEGGVPLLCSGVDVSGERVRRAVPGEGGESEGQGDVETQSDLDSDGETTEDSSGEESGQIMVCVCVRACVRACVCV